jgi:hypothetical protein
MLTSLCRTDLTGLFDPRPRRTGNRALAIRCLALHVLGISTEVAQVVLDGVVGHVFAI